MSEIPEKSTNAPAGTGTCRRWMARIGVGGFVFFLIKGIAWLIVPALLAAGLTD